MLDFAALPPEINSGRMYLGPGSGPMIAAGAAWDALAAELSITATGWGSVISELTGHRWLRPASVAMAGAAASHLVWLRRTAEQAGQTAAQAGTAAAAYELAFAMTVPPPVIAANRSLLLALIATNFFGQNSAAIASTEMHYAEMWLQDATAMYSYAGSSAAARQLAPFTEPQSTSNPAGPTAQSAATPTSALLSIVEHVPNVTNSVRSTSNAVTSGRGIFAINTRLAFQDSTESAPRPLAVGLISVGGSPRSASIAGMGSGRAGGEIVGATRLARHRVRDPHRRSGIAKPSHRHRPAGRFPACSRKCFQPVGAGHAVPPPSRYPPAPEQTDHRALPGRRVAGN